MSALHVVVVWEWRRGGAWLPHAAGVARALERAHGKQLTRVVLADAEPALQGHYVNLRTLTQTEHAEDAESARSSWRVRRAVYSVQSPAARGVGWSWAAYEPHAQPQYEPLPMEVQCRLEEAWARGGEVQWEGWAAAPAPARMAARHRAGALRLLRRAPAPPYPLARAPQPPPPPPPPRPLPPLNGRSSRGPRQCEAAAAAAAAMASGGRSVSPPRDRKPGLARQLLHNLNIFRETRAGGGDVGEGDGEGPPGDGADDRPRRLSLDTVSTYLSHESKDGDQRASVGSLLNCSAGSDDVFEEPAAGGGGGDCPACRRALPLPAPAPAPAPAPPAAQPPGSMSWRLQPERLPNCDAERSILVTYSFQSGVQSVGQPRPGAPYYAVGFPRHSVLPDCVLGRAVLLALRRCWAARVLFAVAASHTTGREHVVAWRVEPPPARAANYRAPPHPHRLLRAALLRLQRLLPPDCQDDTDDDAHEQ